MLELVKAGKVAPIPVELRGPLAETSRSLETARRQQGDRRAPRCCRLHTPVIAGICDSSSESE